MHVLVTGGCGYVGSVLVGKLLGRGHDVTAVDINSSVNALADGLIVDNRIGTIAAVANIDTMIDAGADPKGGMMKKPDQAPHPSLNVYFVVKDVDDTLEKVQAAGGCVIIGKTEIEVGWWAMFMDPDNIPVGIFQPKA